MTIKEAAFLFSVDKERMVSIIEIGIPLPKSGTILKLSAQKIGNEYMIDDADLDSFIKRFDDEDPGRYPPVNIRRDLLVECRYRCAVCRDNAPVLQFHHLLGWEKLKHYDTKHMMAVCGTCHDSCGIGRIDKLAQYRFKALLAETVYKPDLGNTGTDVKRRRDLVTFQRIFATLNTTNVDQFLYEASFGYLLDNFATYFWEGFHVQVESATFHLYDTHAFLLINSFHDAVAEMFSVDDRMHYVASHEKLTFGDTPTDAGWQAAVSKFHDAAARADGIFRQLLVYLKEHYVEIDFEASDKESWARYLKHLKD